MGHLYDPKNKKILAFKVFTKSVNWDGSSQAMDPAALKHCLYQLKKDHGFVAGAVLTDADSKTDTVVDEFNLKPVTLQL